MTLAVSVTGLLNEDAEILVSPGAGPGRPRPPSRCNDPGFNQWAPATPIMAALSVQNALDGRHRVTPRRFGLGLHPLAKPPLARTPPPAPTILTPVSSTAWKVLSTRTSTIASCTDAATSASGGSRPEAWAFFRNVITEVFSPENEK